MSEEVELMLLSDVRRLEEELRRTELFRCRDIERLRADNARLRSLLEPLLGAAEDGWGHNPKGEHPGECAGCDAVLATRAALASSEASEWLRERERRVAERVREACARYVDRCVHEDNADTGNANTRFGNEVRSLDLAALLKEET